MTNLSPFTPFSEYYLSEYNHYNGECFVTFNITHINFERKEIIFAVTRLGGISHQTYDLLLDNDGEFYFEYGVMNERIYLNEFKEII